MYTWSFGGFNLENEKRVKDLNDTFHRNSGQILGMALHIESYLDYFIANYFANPQNYRTFLLKDLILTKMNFDRKRNIFEGICKEEGIDKKQLNAISESIRFIQKIRNRVAHDETIFYHKEEKIVLQKKKSVRYKKDELEITDALVNEVDEKRLFCLQEMVKVEMDIRDKNELSNF